MMSSTYGTAVPTPLPSGYRPDYMLDDWSRRMLVASNSRRFSRGSNSQWPGGNMRVTKPTSASNSPRSSMLASSRRRTVFNEGMATQARIRQQFMDQAILSAALEDNSHSSFSDSTTRSSRPVSWHPGTQLQQQQQQHYPHHQQYPESQFCEVTTGGPSPACYPVGPLSNYAQCSPVPAAYSCQASPVPYSPLPLPFAADYQQTPTDLAVDDWTLPVQAVPFTTTTSTASTSQPTAAQTISPPATSHAQPTFESYTPLTAPTASSSVNHGLDWATFAAHGFDMSPPTPDSFPPAPAPEPAVSTEESIPFQPLEDEEEEEGEILVGMGLYDTPGKDLPDTGLDNYLITTSHLLGTATGKGLKLLEAWEPPASDLNDDDDDDDDDEDEAAKGSDKATKGEHEGNI